MSVDDGGPAFPQRGGVKQYRDADSNGMTMRDYFAAKAMQVHATGDYSSWADLASDVYEIADAMLKERNKQQRRK